MLILVLLMHKLRLWKMRELSPVYEYRAICLKRQSVHIRILLRLY